jgi:hypothetical protein
VIELPIYYLAVLMNHDAYLVSPYEFALLFCSYYPRDVPHIGQSIYACRRELIFNNQIKIKWAK